MAAAMTSAGCTLIYGSMDFMLEQTEISLTWKKEIQMTYDPQTCQMAYNEDRNEYRVYDDNLSNWFTFRCSERPGHLDQIITADVSWTGEKSEKNFEELEFQVIQTDENGMYWLVNTSNSIGVIIKDIQ